MMNARLFPFVIVLLGVIICVSPATALAQFASATILGTVRDDTGGVLPGVTVSLTATATGRSVTTVTDGTGSFNFVNVEIGTYRVTAELQGFSTAAAEVTARVNERLRVDLVMQVGEISEVVEVVGAAALLESETSDRGEVIEHREIIGLPLNGRKYSDLALLTTGVRKSDKALSREGTFNVHGLRGTMNNFMLDGVDNNSYGTSNQGFSSQVIQLSPDALQEFKVITNNFSAEYGRAGGSVINAAVRSGTSDFHGRAWWFHRNDNVQARDFFTNRSGRPKPDLLRQQFGATFGGPIVPDHTFFFVDYEGFREKRGNQTFSTIPTLEQRQGILGVPVRNPLTGQVFEDGVVPESEISPFARQVFDLLPAPNVPGAGERNNFANADPVTQNTDKADIRFDHKMENLSIFARFSHRKDNTVNPPPITGLAGGSGNGLVRVLNQSMAYGATWTVSSTSLLEGRFGASRTNAGKFPVNFGSAPAGELFGLPGLPTNPQVTGGLPAQKIAGFSDLGQQATNPQHQNPKAYDWKLNYSKIFGNHSLKVGYEHQRIGVNVQDVNPLNGEFLFRGQFSRPEGASGAAAPFNLADFMFGLPSQLSLVNFFVARIEERMHFAYIQDDWKLSPNLTLNLGLRYEYGSPLFENDNRLSNFDPSTNSIILASSGSVENRALVNQDLDNWAPRIGLAWNFMPKTVLRAGYGVSFVHAIQQRVGGANLLPLSAPQVVIGRQVQSPDDPNFRTLRADGNPRDGVPEGFTSSEGFDPTHFPGTLRFIPRDTRTSYVQSWHLTIQREILPNTVTEVAYVGNLGLKLNVLGDFNEAQPNPPGQIIPLEDRRPIPNFGVISTAFNRAGSNYHAFQWKVERRSTNDLSLLNSFTWSKAIDNAAGSLEDPNGNRGNPQSILNLNNDRGLSAFDQRINNVTSVVWNVPVGRGRHFGSGMTSAMDALLGGWQVTFINTLSSGAPVNLLYDPSDDFRVTAALPSHEGGVSFRPNLIGDGSTRPPDDQLSVDNFLNKENIVAPTDPSMPFGTAGRNIARTEGFYQLDLSLVKNFNLPFFPLNSEEARMEFRADFFNLLNQTNFRAPNSNLSSSAFGTINSTFAPREIQFALKVLF